MTRGWTNLARAAARVTLLSMAVLASACTKPIERDDARMATTPEQERSAPTQPAVRPQEAAVEAPKTPTTTSKPVEQPVAATEPAPAAPVHTVAELMGKRQAEVTALMGAPARIEQRAASTVWVYEGGDCGLDVFFFLDMATSDERVLTVAPTGQPAAAAAAAAESPTAGTPAADPAGTGAAADPAGTSAGTAVDAVDVCYGKLRRS